MFKKEIKGRIYIVGEPTLRQNKALIKYLEEYKISFTAIDKEIDIGVLLITAAREHNLEKLLAIMLHPEGEVWKDGCNNDILEQLSDLTETEIEEIVSEFMRKKKAWIYGLIRILESYFLQMILHLGRKPKKSSQ